MSAESWPDGQDLAEALQDAEQQSSSRMVVMLTPQQLLESEQIHWRRDFDAVALGWVLGVLTVLAIQGVW